MAIDPLTLSALASKIRSDVRFAGAVEATAKAVLRSGRDGHADLLIIISALRERLEQHARELSAVARRRVER